MDMGKRLFSKCFLIWRKLYLFLLKHNKYEWEIHKKTYLCTN